MFLIKPVIFQNDSTEEVKHEGLFSRLKVVTTLVSTVTGFKYINTVDIQSTIKTNRWVTAKVQRVPPTRLMAKARTAIISRKLSAAVCCPLLQTNTTTGPIQMSQIPSNMKYVMQKDHIYSFLYYSLSYLPFLMNTPVHMLFIWAVFPHNTAYIHYILDYERPTLHSKLKDFFF